MAMEGVAGVTAIETRVAAVTVRVAELLVTPFSAAVMFEVPVDTPVARPELLMVATEVVAEFQVAVAVRFCVVESV